MVFISLREYKTSSPISLTVEQRDALRRLVPDLRIEAALGELSAYLLTPGSRVGAVALENLAVEIAPKLSIQQVLFLVSYSLGLAKWGDKPFEMTMPDSLVEAIVPRGCPIVWRFDPSRQSRSRMLVPTTLRCLYLERSRPAS